MSLPANLSRRLALWAVLAVVGLAFADSSIVVLALPELLRKYDASVTGIAWVVTSYNLAVAIGSLALIGLVGRLSVIRLVRVGCVLFCGATIACGLANELWALVAFRVVQGLGGAMLLVGSLRLARSLASTSRRGTASWSAATVIGAAVGPACGGLLTELLGWRSIFFAQAPFAALALAMTAAVVLPLEPASDAAKRPRLAINAALVFVSASLVALLFLAVVLLIDVWSLSPLKAAAAVSAVPLGALAAQLSVKRPGAASTRAGVVLLAGGLAGMAYLPSLNIAWAAVALSVSGAGLGLVLPRLTQLAIPDGVADERDVAWAVGARHVGLVAGLLVLAPLLAADLDTAGNRATLGGIATVLEAPVPAHAKLQLALDLAPVLAQSATHGLPHFSRVLAHKPITGATALGHSLDSVVKGSLTRGFRRAFLLAALLALFAWLPVQLARQEPALGRRRSLALPAAAGVVALALVGSELAQGALGYGHRPALSKPCSARPLPAAAGTSERTLISGLDLLACRLHVGREQLIAKVAGTSLANKLAGYVQRAAGIPGWLLGLLSALLKKA